MYVIQTHDGKTLSIKQEDDTKIRQLAQQLELTAVELTNGSVVYLSKGTVARLEKRLQTEADRIIDPERTLDRPDFRGRPSPAKETLRKRFTPT